MLAYDIAILPHAPDRSGSACHGWCFGLPPGIQPPQWPLDPATGYPLQHSFTLLLPEDHRCHGPDIVAVSFFASAMEHNDGGPRVKAPDIRTAMDSVDAPSDPELMPFWHSLRTAHPRLHRLEDILGIAYAAILLTQAEFDGPACLPPKLDGNRHRDALRAPAWLRVGPLHASLAYTQDPQWIRDADGQASSEILAESRALHWTPRAHDPNAGRSPVDDGVGPDDYIQPLFPDATGEYQFSRLGGGARPQPHRRHHAVVPVDAVVQPSLHRVRGRDGRLQFRRRQRAARPARHEVRVGLRLMEAEQPSPHPVWVSFQACRMLPSPTNAAFRTEDVTWMP